VTTKRKIKGNVMSTTLAALAFVSTVGGGIWYIGKPPYANEEWARTQIAGLQLQYAIGREDSLERRIFDLEVQKRKMGPSWPVFMETELQRLKAERDRVKDDIRRFNK